MTTEKKDILNLLIFVPFSAQSTPRNQRHFQRGKLKGSSESWKVPIQGLNPEKKSNLEKLQIYI